MWIGRYRLEQYNLKGFWLCNPAAAPGSPTFDKASSFQWNFNEKELLQLLRLIFESYEPKHFEHHPFRHNGSRALKYSNFSPLMAHLNSPAKGLSRYIVCPFISKVNSNHYFGPLLSNYLNWEKNKSNLFLFWWCLFHLALIKLIAELHISLFLHQISSWIPFSFVNFLFFFLEPFSSTDSWINGGSVFVELTWVLLQNYCMKMEFKNWIS